ncbi:transposase InsO family protein [Bradyrhizobium japonicum]
MRELANVRWRFGYRRLHVLMCREDLVINHKKFRRRYLEERLQVRRRSGRKRALGTRMPIGIPQGPNQRWSLDFVSDAFVDSRGFASWRSSMTSAANACTLGDDSSLPGLRVPRELEAVIMLRGRPAMCVFDNGTELTCLVVLRWSQEIRIEWHYIAPGKPTQNAVFESFM